VISLDLTLPLDGFTLEAKLALSGNVTALMGPSGAGKSSLLEVLAGVRRGAKGTLEVDGERWLSGTRALPPERRRVGWVPQDALLFPHLTVAQNVRFGAGAKASLAHEAMARLELLHLTERHPYTLSGGERMRVALARALAVGPRLLLLDEPLAAIDAELKGRIRDYLLSARALLGGPMIFVTHSEEDARALADTVVRLERGRIGACGPPDEVLSPRSPGRLPDTPGAQR
jgi:molybdate transport system ATP-binding protein